MVFHTDTLNFPDRVYKKKIYLPYAHNIVWDHQRKLLWSAGRNKLYALKYNFNCKQPDLIVSDSMELPDTDAHDLFPVYGKDQLWLTTIGGVFKINLSQKTVTAVGGGFTKDIKSVSSGPDGFQTIIILPKEKWWTDEVLDINGKKVFQQKGLKIYKSRWLLSNEFSYADTHSLRFCK